MKSLLRIYRYTETLYKYQLQTRVIHVTNARYLRYKRQASRTPEDVRIVTFIASLIESSDFFGMFAKLCRLWRPNRRVFLWRDCQSDYRETALTSMPPLARKPHVSVHEEITTPQYILQKVRWKYRVSQSSTEPGDASALLNPLATPIPPMSPLNIMWLICGLFMGRSYCFAKSRNIWATARFVKWVVSSFL
jgi:hypothetical protein